MRPLPTTLDYMELIGVPIHDSSDALSIMRQCIKYMYGEVAADLWMSGDDMAFVEVSPNKFWFYRRLDNVPFPYDPRRTPVTIETFLKPDKPADTLLKVHLYTPKFQEGILPAGAVSVGDPLSELFPDPTTALWLYETAPHVRVLQMRGLLLNENPERRAEARGFAIDAPLLPTLEPLLEVLPLHVHDCLAPAARFA